MSLDLFQTGTYLRCPGGNIENAVEQKANGVTWAAMNIGGDACVDHDPSVWAKAKGNYQAAGVAIGPWMHCHSLDDVIRVIDVGVLWQADFIGVNLEDVVGEKISLQEVGGYLLDFWVNKYGKPVHMASLPWLENGAGWQYVSFAYIALELFPEVSGQKVYLDEYQRCIDHAFAEGAKKVTLLYSTQSQRSVYPDVAHCLYTADNVTDWPEWKDDVAQVIPKPPVPPTPKPPEVTMLTAKQFPFTGPCYGPGTKQTTNYSTVKGLKRAMIRLGLLDQELGTETDDYGADLKAAMKRYQKSVQLTQSGNYGKSTWLCLRAEKLVLGPHKGEYAMDAKALAYVKADLLTMCYPHPEGSLSTVCQGLHPTEGVPGNYAMDFCAPGRTPVYAVERATITRLSGHDPSNPPNNTIGIWGWSIYYKTAAGYEYFSTHYGARNVKVGQIVEVGQVIAAVGSWPGDPGRSHTHLGVSSPFGTTDAKKKIEAISKATHLPLL